MINNVKPGYVNPLTMVGSGKNISWLNDESDHNNHNHSLKSYCNDPRSLFGEFLHQPIRNHAQKMLATPNTIVTLAICPSVSWA